MCVCVCVCEIVTEVYLIMTFLSWRDLMEYVGVIEYIHMKAFGKIWSRLHNMI